MLVISPDNKYIKELYGLLSQKLIVNDLGEAKVFLGIEITRNRSNRSIFLGQKAYTEKILQRFNKPILPKEKVSIPIPLGIKLEPNNDQSDPKDIQKFQQEVGSLMYFTTKTRPDLAYPIGLVARYMSNPGLQHQKLLEKIWKYLGSTPYYGLNYQSDALEVQGYCDADWGGDIPTRRSTTGFTYLFRGAAISWNSKLQNTVALSSCEAEYMALKEAIKEQLFIGAIIANNPHLKSISSYNTTYTDSLSAIELAKNPQYHHRTKHIDIQYHFIREKYQQGISKLLYVPTKNQIADGLTKPIDLSKWQDFTTSLGLISLEKTKSPTKEPPLY
jgi:hypothetical protein